MGKTWKKGRGKLGFMQPLLGQWEASQNSPIGPLLCVRAFEEVLGGSYIRLTARWMFGSGIKAKDASTAPSTGSPSKPKKPKAYEEIALIGVGDDRNLCFWSFTSDGKRSQGTLSEATDLHPLAICFEAHMPAGLARMAYWPDDADGFFWAVESKNAKGWNRFTEHHYRPLPAPPT